MIFFLTLILKILVLTIPLLLGVAFLVLAERKVLASMQRRKGPNVVGIFGIFQPKTWFINKFLGFDGFRFIKKIIFCRLTTIKCNITRMLPLC